MNTQIPTVPGQLSGTGIQSREKGKMSTLWDLVWSYSIYSLGLLDSSLNSHRFFQTSSYYTFKMKTEKQSTSLWVFCFFPSEALQLLVLPLSLHPHLSSVLIMTPTPVLVSQDFSHTSTVTVTTLDCSDLGVYVATSYKLSEGTDSMHLPPPPALASCLTSWRGSAKLCEMNQWINYDKIMMGMDLPGYDLFCFITDIYRCFPLNTTLNYVIWFQEKS